MKNILLMLTAMLFITACAVKKPDMLVKDTDVERIIRTLAADDMQGRRTFTPGIDRAAKFIENEFRAIGLQPLSGEKSFRQQFYMNRITMASAEVMLDGKPVEPGNVMVITDRTGINWNSDPQVEIQYIRAGESFFTRYREIIKTDKQTIIYVDEQFMDAFNRLRQNSLREHVAGEIMPNLAAVFILGNAHSKSFRVNFTNRVEKMPLFNVAGMLPGKSKSKELVVFSGHYDHLGIIKPVDGDSIANGADDDASGTTAVIALARYYKKLNNNERTLLFVAFTGEEMGGYGSKYFSQQLNADDVVAMFNIEMIGKDSKFGRNSAFITGYERSDFGKILQKNLVGTEFKFYPDPYPEQNLFYRSDNATLAELGVPAHTISTDQIDKDKLYHTVKDEFKTLDLANIMATIKAIALSSRTIVAGTDTPARIPKPE